MAEHQRTHSDATKERRNQVLRARRFAEHFRRWQEGQPVRTYDSRWLAYLQNQINAAHQRGL